MDQAPPLMQPVLQPGATTPSQAPAAGTGFTPAMMTSPTAAGVTSPTQPQQPMGMQQMPTMGMQQQVRVRGWLLCAIDSSYVVTTRSACVSVYIHS